MKTAIIPASAAQKKPLEKVKEADLAIIGKALNAGLTQAEAERLYRDHGAGALASGIQALEKRLAMPADRIDPVGNPASYLRALLRSKTPESPASTVPSLAEAGRMGKELERNKTALHEEWLRRRKDELRSLFQESPQSEQEELLRRFRASLTNQPMVKRFDTSGWNHRMIRDTFAGFLGEAWHGTDWNKPGTDDILALALSKAPSTA